LRASAGSTSWSTTPAFSGTRDWSQSVAALRGRKRELVMTTKAKVGLGLKLLAPGIVDKMARAALKQ
jgi:hypothetical protein